MTNLTFHILIFYHIWYNKGCVMHIYSLSIKISLQAMESHGPFQPHLKQKGLVWEYNSCGLEYFWANISEEFLGRLNR